MSTSVLCILFYAKKACVSQAFFDASLSTACDRTSDYSANMKVTFMFTRYSTILPSLMITF